MTTKRIWNTGFVLLMAVALISCFDPVVDPTDGALIVNITNLPAGIESVTVTVEGDDFATITGEFTGQQPEAEPIVVPIGTGRQITVVVGVSTTGPVTEYTGTGTVDIAAGAPSIADVAVRITRTKLVIPDALNRRLVQIDSIATGVDTWVEHDLGIGSAWDAEVGPDGKIYFALLEDGGSGIVRIDGFPVGASQTLIYEASPDGPIAIDHANEIIYFLEGGFLYSVPLAGGVATDYSAATSSFVDGTSHVGQTVTVDDAGAVYVLVWEDTPDMESPQLLRVIKLDTEGAPVVIADGVIYSAPAASTFSTRPMDLAFIGDALYAVFYGDDTNGPVVRIDNTLSVVESYGTLYTGVAGPDNLYGPARFIGHLNPEIQFLDDSGDTHPATLPGSESHDYAIQIDDLEGSGRETFGSNGSGTNEFELFGFWFSPPVD